MREMNHIGLRVCDIEKALKLYRDILGGELIRNGHSADGLSRYLYVQIGSSVLELLKAGKPEDEGYVHIAFLTEHGGLDSAYAKMTEDGYSFHVPPKPAASGNGRLGFFRDKAGIEYEFIEREENIRKYPFETELVSRFLYTEICVPDEEQEATRALLSKKLGFVHCDDDIFRFGCDAVKVSAGNARINSIRLETCDLALTKAKLESEGFKPVDTEYGFCFVGAGSELVCFEQRRQRCV